MSTPKPTPANDQQAPPSWAGVFGPVEFTPEEEAALDVIWASPEMQEAVRHPAPPQVDMGDDQE